MAYRASVYNVMIASPSDVGPARDMIRRVLAEWNVVHSEKRGIVLLPLGWETHSSPEMGEPAQAVLNKQLLSRSDLLVGVFWTRLGTPTQSHSSGSVEEIEEHLKLGKPVMLYFSNQPVRPDSVDSEQYERLVAFKESCKQRGLLEEYEDIADFRDKFGRHLQLKLNDDSYFQSREATDPTAIVDLSPRRPDPSISAEARELLATAAKDDGVIMRVNHLGGTDISAGGREFVEGQNPRDAARWEAGVYELEQRGLVKDKVGKREVFQVTHEGYRLADALPERG